MNISLSLLLLHVLPLMSFLSLFHQIGAFSFLVLARGICCEDRIKNLQTILGVFSSIILHITVL